MKNDGMDEMNIREYLENHKLLTDGAMGTYFDTVEKENYICSEEANITNPSLVRQIHKNYVKNGAQLLRSNTFLANEGTFLSLTQAKAEAFENITLKQLIIAGYRLAEEVAREAYSESYPVFPAADIGPILEGKESEETDILQQYYEICDSFLEAGANIFVLETFPDTEYVLKMAEYIRKSCPEAFIIGQFSLTPTGYSRTGFHYKTILRDAVQSGLLDGAGLNCGIGAAHMKRFLEAYIEEYGVPEDMILTALPNCGYPQIVRGHVIYSDSVTYFGEKIKEVSELGVRALGGCCGTTPEYIGEIYRTLFQAEHTLKVPTRIVWTDAAGRIQKRQEQLVHIKSAEGKNKTIKKEQVVNTFRRKLEKGELVCAVELDPPFDANDTKLVNGAKELLSTKADIITIADSPLARSRADASLMAAKIKMQIGMDVMPHLACRDKNRIAIRSGLLGSYVNEIRNYLFVTGDPVAREDREFTKGVFDFNSIRLMKFAQSMNQEIFADDTIFYGGALNQNGASPENIAGRMIKKMEAGCSYFLTQPVYDEEGIKRLAFLKERTGAKILIGIMPLVSRRNALFIKNEMPGIYVPNRVVEKYKENASREEYEEAAVEISKEIIEMGKEVGAGFYFMTPFNRVSLVKSILEYV